MPCLRGHPGLLGQARGQGSSEEKAAAVRVGAGFAGRRGRSEPL